MRLAYRWWDLCSRLHESWLELPKRQETANAKAQHAPMGYLLLVVVSL